jgi:hypothetical protein
VRDLTVQELCIGRIILHALFMLVLGLTNDIEIMNLVGKYDRNCDYQDNIKNTMIYLDTCRKYDWDTLKELWCVNDEKIL